MNTPINRDEEITAIIQITKEICTTAVISRGMNQVTIICSIMSDARKIQQELFKNGWYLVNVLQGQTTRNIYVQVPLNTR